MLKTFLNALKMKELRSRIFFTFFIILVVRIGCLIPAPGINSAAVADYLANSLGDSLSFLNSFTGGSFENMSLFALNVTPYITSSIIIQLLTIAIPALEELQRDGEDGRKKINDITRYLTVGLAVMESAGLAIGFGREGLLNDYGFFAVFTVIVILTAGSTLVMWLGEQVTQHGVGNGISIILLVNIISRMPRDISALYTQFVAGKDLVKAVMAGCVIVAVIIGTVVLVVILQDAVRKIPVAYAARRQGGSKGGNVVNSNIPLKINTAGVIPIIFASSLFSVPSIVINLFGIKATGTIANTILVAINQNYWFNKNYPWGYLGLAIYIALVLFFAYFYTSITFNPIEIANNMKKSGGFIPGIRPGKPTQDYLNKILNYIIFIGAAGLCIVCLIPTFFNGVFQANVSFGGTSLIIVVGVVIETLKQIESQMLVRNYTGFLNR